MIPVRESSQVVIIIYPDLWNDSPMYNHKKKTGSRALQSHWDGRRSMGWIWMNHRDFCWDLMGIYQDDVSFYKQHIIWVCLKRLYVAAYPKKYHWSLGTLFQTKPFELIKWTIWVQEAMAAMAWNPLDPKWVKSSFERTSWMMIMMNECFVWNHQVAFQAISGDPNQSLALGIHIFQAGLSNAPVPGILFRPQHGIPRGVMAWSHHPLSVEPGTSTLW